MTPLAYLTRRRPSRRKLRAENGGDDDEEPERDLRGRVIAAIEDGLLTQEPARRFGVGISTAGAWYRRYRETGETDARTQGQPSRSKLGAREAFILGLIDEV